MLRKKLVSTLIPTIITSILSIFSMVMPVVFAGAVIYSLIANPISKKNERHVFLNYLIQSSFYILSGILGWEIYTYFFFNDFYFSNIHIPALFSFLYYNILLIQNRYIG